MSLPAPAATQRPTARGGRPLVRRFLSTPAAVVGLVVSVILVLVAVFASDLAPSDPFKPVGQPLGRPSVGHLMGLDNLGRDVLSGVVAGAHTSLYVVGWVVLMSLVIGLLVGTVSGWVGGLVDDLLMRVTEIFQSVPRFFLAILVVTWFGRGLHNLILLLGLTSWPLLARVVRAEVLSVRQREFVEASRSMGASGLRIVVRHVLPNVLPSALVIVSVTGSRVILLEASLAFLGLGDPNLMSWGGLINNAQGYLQVAWWMSVFPGAAIACAAIGLSLLSDGLSDLLNPLLSREHLAAG